MERTILGCSHAIDPSSIFCMTCKGLYCFMCTRQHLECKFVRVTIWAEKIKCSLAEKLDALQKQALEAKLFSGERAQSLIRSLKEQVAEQEKRAFEIFSEKFSKKFSDMKIQIEEKETELLKLHKELDQHDASELWSVEKALHRIQAKESEALEYMRLNSYAKAYAMFKEIDGVYFDYMEEISQKQAAIARDLYLLKEQLDKSEANELTVSSHKGGVDKKASKFVPEGILPSCKILYSLKEGEVKIYNLAQRRITLAVIPQLKNFTSYDWILVRDKIYVCGGVWRYHILKSTMELDINTWRAEKKANMNLKKSNLSLGQVNSCHIYSIGGDSKNSPNLRICERYCIKEDKWVRICDLNQGRNYPSVCCFGNWLLYAIGGTVYDNRENLPTRSIEMLDTLEEAAEWKKIPILNVALFPYPKCVCSIPISTEEIIMFSSCDSNLSKLSIRTGRIKQIPDYSGDFPTGKMGCAKGYICTPQKNHLLAYSGITGKMHDLLFSEEIREV